MPVPALQCLGAGKGLRQTTNQFDTNRAERAMCSLVHKLSAIGLAYLVMHVHR
jgi:hypothetical protein